MFCMLLRKLLGGARVLAVRQIDGDRVAEIAFGAVDDFGEAVERVLCVEIMGRHSNIIAYAAADGRVLDSIHRVTPDMSRVREMRPGVIYTRPPGQDKLNPETLDAEGLKAALAGAPARLDKAIAATVSGISAVSARELAYRLTGDASPHLDAEARAALAEPLAGLLASLPPSEPIILHGDQGEAIDVFPFPMLHLDRAGQRPIPEGQSAALDLFYLSRDRRERMGQKSQSLVRSLKAHIERAESKIAIHRDILQSDARIDELRISGELLTANLHLLKKAQAQVTVPDYYTGGEREIALDERLSPAQNAQGYYRQYQKMRAAQRHALQQLEIIEAQHRFLTEQLSDVRKCGAAEELDEIRQALVDAKVLRPTGGRKKQAKQSPSRPLSCVSSDGIGLLIGKNSAQNERITQGARPENTWLHAKDMPGSHVLIQHAGEPPEATLREAAQLAAWFSQGYRSSRVPMDYTLRRHVRKPSGAATGYFIYGNQKTLYVTPDEAEIRRLLGDAVI